MPFKKALLYARSFKLKSWREWEAWCKSGKRPANIPFNPHTTYKHDGWQGHGHWLGTGRVAPKDRKFLPFKKVLLYARDLKLKSQTEWKDWAKTGVRPANMPSCPNETYGHDGWQGHGHWLGTGNVVGGRKLAFLPFDKALIYARSLKLKSNSKWRVWCKSKARDANIPTTPDRVYKHDGWQGYGHWLGTL